MNRLEIAGARIGMAALAGVCVAVLSGCGPKPDESKPVRPVLVVQAEPASQGAAISFIGDIRARDEAPVAFRVGGRIIERNVRLGSHVRAGDPLARLDPADLDRAVQVDEANLVAAQSHREWAHQQLERTRAEQARGLSSVADVEQAQDASQSSIAAADAAEARLRLSRQQRSYANLVADADGTITQELAQLDQVVSAGQGVYVLSRLQDREAVFEVPETAAASFHAAQAVVVRASDGRGQPVTARVSEVAQAADAASHSVTVRAILSQQVESLGLGATVIVGRTDPLPDHVDSYWVPATAIFHSGQDPAVWIVDRNSGHLSLKTVTLIEYEGRRARLKGVSAGDWLVAAGVHTLDVHDDVRAVEAPRPEDGQP